MSRLAGRVLELVMDDIVSINKLAERVYRTRWWSVLIPILGADENVTVKLKGVCDASLANVEHGMIQGAYMILYVPR